MLTTKDLEVVLETKNIIHEEHGDGFVIVPNVIDDDAFCWNETVHKRLQKARIVHKIVDSGPGWVIVRILSDKGDL